MKNTFWQVYHLIKKLAEVSNIRGLFPKDDYQWLHWVEQGKMIYGNKEKIQALSTQRRIDLAEVSSQDARISSDIHCLDSIDTILGKFGSVNDIFTQEFSFYAQQKEFYSIYRKIHASFAWDAVYEDDARFYAEKIFKAIHEQDTDTLKQYASFEDVYEISDVVREILSEKSGFSTIQSQEQLNKAVSFVRNKKWSNTMEEKTMTNKVTVGEVVIVRRPHTQQAKLYWYGDVDEAFDAWKNEGIFVPYENAEDYINELGLEVEEIEAVKQRLTEAGIGLDSTFVEFSPSPSRDMEIYPWDGNKLKFLSAIIEDDMHAAGIFIAQDGETYGDFVERILAGTRGHNEPSKEAVMATLGLDPQDIEMELYSNIHNDESYEKLDRPIENMSREEACALLGERLIKEVESLHTMRFGNKKKGNLRQMSMTLEHGKFLKLKTDGTMGQKNSKNGLPEKLTMG